MDPRVSVIVPCYNYGHFVVQAVDSILAQTLDELEVIVIDDASTDDTPQVLARYASEPRVCVIRHAHNHGHIRTYNEGLARARGQFVGLLSADDYYLRSDALARQVTVFDMHAQIGLVYPAHTFVDETGQPYWVYQRWPSDYVRSGLDEFKTLIVENYVPASGTLVRRTCHEELGDYTSSLPHAADWDLWLRLTTRYDVGYVAEPLLAYRVHGNNMSTALRIRNQTSDHVLTVERAFDALPANAPPGLRQLRTSAVRCAWLRAAAVSCAQGKAQTAWIALLDAVHRSPELLATSEFYAVAGRLLLMTLLGHQRYTHLAERRAGRRELAGSYVRN
jgi:glycosyltransferase involved in cell wall biosynthesis